MLGFRNLQEKLENIHSFNDLILTNIISFCPNVKLVKLEIFMQILGEQGQGSIGKRKFFEYLDPKYKMRTQKRTSCSCIVKFIYY